MMSLPIKIRDNVIFIKAIRDIPSADINSQELYSEFFSTRVDNLYDTRIIIYDMHNLTIKEDYFPGYVGDNPNCKCRFLDFSNVSKNILDHLTMILSHCEKQSAESWFNNFKQTYRIVLPNHLEVFDRNSNITEISAIMGKKINIALTIGDCYDEIVNSSDEIVNNSEVQKGQRKKRLIWGVSQIKESE